jgi:hypothetical protein
MIRRHFISALAALAGAAVAPVKWAKGATPKTRLGDQRVQWRNYSFRYSPHDSKDFDRMIRAAMQKESA